MGSPPSQTGTPASGVLLGDKAAIEAVLSLKRRLDELLSAARPFGEMAQEMLNGHPTGRVSPGVPQRLLAALAAFDTPESDRTEATR